MLWQHYVLRRGPEVQDLWDHLFESREVGLLYIAGRGFDVRAQAVMRAFIEGISSSDYAVENADLLLLGFTGYQLSEELKEETELNANALLAMFKPLGTATNMRIGSSAGGEDDISA